MTDSNHKNVIIKDQYSDFLVRASDPYAQAKYDLLHKILGGVKGQTCLVIGAGSGEFACQMAANGAEVTAVDIEQSYIDLCRSTAESSGIRLSYILSTLENLELKDQFDLVVATDVIEHIKDDQAAANKILSLTRSRGRIVITVPAMNFLFGHHDRTLGHYRRYSKKGVARLFSDKAEVLVLRYFGLLLIPITLLFSVILKKPYPVAKAGSEVGKRSFIGLILKSVLFIERILPFPLGTSVLSLFRKN